jgi:methionine synthase II (cobalamin-independent)
MRLPFHADHIGSLIRPASLSETQDKADAGSATASELRATQKAAIEDIAQKQLAHGVRSLTSGEFDRKYYFSGFFEKLPGFREVSPVPWELARLSAPPIAALKKAGKQYPMAAVCEGRIGYGASPYLEDWRLLKAAVPPERRAECKFTMPPPCYFHLRLAPGRCYSPEAYADDDAFFADLAAAYRKELRTLYDDGLRNVQIDDPTLAYFCSDDMLQALRGDGVDPDRLFDTYLKAHNDCIADKPDDLHVGLHICRGMETLPPPILAGSLTRHRAKATLPSRCTSARAPTRRLPSASSRRSTTTPSSSSTTTRAPAASSPCASSRATRTSSSASSPQRTRPSRTPRP